MTPELIDVDLLDEFPLEVLYNYQILPLKRVQFQLTVAMADPLDVVAEDVVRSITGCKIVRRVAPASQIRAALEGRLGQVESDIEQILSQIPDYDDVAYIEVEEEDETASGQSREAVTPPVIQLVNSILTDAISMKASDIHIEPQKESLRIRYRLDGSLTTMLELPKKVQNACLSRIKLMSGMDIAESRKPQDGRTRARLEGREVDLRVSSLPTFRGEKLVLRILDPEAVVIDLDRLGFSPEDFGRIQQALHSSQGMLLCTGPTGSGKTSTLYSALIQLNTEDENVVTVEDPVEYQLKGVNQVQVNARAGLTFSAALRSILRQDPDVVLLGEIRDLETAEIAVQAAQTGHLVLSTLHTNDAVSTLNRLILMGVEPYMLASSLLCVLAQRLVRRLCSQCKQLGAPSETSLRLLSLAGIHPPDQGFWKPVGCDHCRHLGYKGRLGLFEVLMVTDRIRELLLTGARESELERVARIEGMKSLLEDGLEKCYQGQTSLEEVLRTITVRRQGGHACQACGALNEESFRFCSGCGTGLQQACPACQRALSPHWLFCPDCRHSLQASISPVRPGRQPEPTLRSEAPLAISPLAQVVSVGLPDSALLALRPEFVKRNWELGSYPSLDQARSAAGWSGPQIWLVDFDCLKSVQASDWVTEVKQANQPQGAEVVLLSQLGPQGIQGLELGADEYLPKPLDPIRLLARMDQSLARLTSP